MTMRNGTYKGPIEKLRGERAILQTSPAVDYVLAQFDKRGLVHGDPPLAVKLDTGWHRFPLTDFDVDLEWSAADARY